MLIGGPPCRFTLTADDTRRLTSIHAGLPEGHERFIVRSILTHGLTAMRDVLGPHTMDALEVLDFAAREPVLRPGKLPKGVDALVVHDLEQLPIRIDYDEPPQGHGLNWYAIRELALAMVHGRRYQEWGDRFPWSEFLDNLRDQYNEQFREQLHEQYLLRYIDEDVAFDLHTCVYTRMVMGRENPFWEALFAVYRSGGFPGGWEGSHPEGRLIAYYPLQDDPSAPPVATPDVSAARHLASSLEKLAREIPPGLKPGWPGPNLQERCEALLVNQDLVREVMEFALKGAILAGGDPPAVLDAIMITDWDEVPEINMICPGEEQKALGRAINEWHKPIEAEEERQWGDETPFGEFETRFRVEIEKRFRRELSYGSPLSGMYLTIAADLVNIAYARWAMGLNHREYEMMFSIYQSGGFPCGWKGSYPQGKLMVFYPRRQLDRAHLQHGP